MTIAPWTPPNLPGLQGKGRALALWQAKTSTVTALELGDVARMYVCGITPYDATHLGHAATYVTFDLAGRVLRDAGHEVRYVQNVTDVDDPLLERATRDGVDWRELATSEIELFHTDMTALRVLPPDHHVSVVETMDHHVRTIQGLVAKGVTYTVPTPDAAEDGAQDIYLDLSTQPTFGAASGWGREQMLEVFADRGGDPDRAGKRDALDPLLWRVERSGEPAWDAGELRRGRPGWHVECTTIALDHLGMGFDLQGGGTDLIFPHHEMSAVQAVALTDDPPFARTYAHQAMVGYDGEKMSKSKGNLVRVSDLRRAGVDPMAIRLVLLDKHYRTPWEYTDDLLDTAVKRWDRWTRALECRGDAGADELVDGIRAALADDLDSATAVRLIDDWAAGPEVGAPSPRVTDAIDALLGLRA
ncbi:L-cysteine:1D-myo-inositol 2-amino-2-deoxy-alpha-D-glucopyranoside ligase [Flexivirga endophytica]|uniref:L-cysteine:1D-myo-inositol 2-amino-2-deoxy-alpha-D-glucopyranoside ligase n=1 Tax=Flexivirga endophytica TaxID=1849103 RepID=A0A916TA28_9MICO|nr:cysteine--1-D-myo-inosityl 2-amino-2-deoxy-alpha-D-glucopyranoside ligase [Flexivirga endophytica]GGB35660.1 L-cysteine:1D-myo-inositol 2-amino-2-deoxy-alpha-D-glucopyranoside ligase [Flexivirga endophytica]GHB43396.1 L-cysteine:1D-myo-inositol 2-amino-2-deoxy-alpha-D-glucopyranoside ligase [Flexivirga endophytica]